MTPYYSNDGIVIYHGDTLDFLAGAGFVVDAVVTDPPYASGGRTEAARGRSNGTVSNLQTERGRGRGDLWASKPMDNDQMTTVGFSWLLRAVSRACHSMLVDGGSFLSFIDWRQWPNLVGLLETCNYRVQGMVVWDKGNFALGNGFRGQHELICHAAKGTPNIYDRSCGNVLRSGRVEASDHPTPKPVDLLARMIEVVTPPDGLVLDPFMGSGSTLVAARKAGRRAIGVEIEERYCEVAAERLGGLPRFADDSLFAPSQSGRAEVADVAAESGSSGGDA